MNGCGRTATTRWRVWMLSRIKESFLGIALFGQPGFTKRVKRHRGQCQRKQGVGRSNCQEQGY